jgi:hypothetical protein
VLLTLMTAIHTEESRTLKESAGTVNTILNRNKSVDPVTAALHSGS